MGFITPPLTKTLGPTVSRFREIAVKFAVTTKSHLIQRQTAGSTVDTVDTAFCLCSSGFDTVDTAVVTANLT